MSDTRETLCTIFVVDNFSLICRHSSVSFSVEDNPFGDDEDGEDDHQNPDGDAHDEPHV